MTHQKLEYILNDTDQMGQFIFVKSMADCVNAEMNNAKAIVWCSDDWEQLKELSPANRNYGWMLVSLNIPIYIFLTEKVNLDKLKEIEYNGFYAEDEDLLLSVKKKIENLSS